jgi:hypothetical protein
MAPSPPREYNYTSARFESLKSFRCVQNERAQRTRRRLVLFTERNNRRSLLRREREGLKGGNKMAAHCYHHDPFLSFALFLFYPG